MCLVKVSLKSLGSDHTNTMESEGKRAILQVMVVIMLCDHGYDYDDKKKDQKGRRAIWEVIRFHSREPLVMR